LGKIDPPPPVSLGMETALGVGRKGIRLRELVRSPGRPGSRPEAINKPDFAWHCASALGAAPGSTGLGAGSEHRFCL
jgi:hypothetical protein